MPDVDPEKKLADLAKPAAAGLDELLRLEDLQGEQWLMRLSVGEDSRKWQCLTLDSATNDRMIKERIEESARPITDLVLAFVGMVEWRGSKRLMAYLQYFKSDYKQGLLCLRHLKEGSGGQRFEAFGGLFLIGGCQNIWI